jgi:molybdate transport system regulatory protein
LKLVEYLDILKIRHLIPLLSIGVEHLNITDQMAKLKLKSSQWIVDEHDNAIIGKGRMEILQNIEKTGSINQTAKMMKMSYKAIWSKIKATEKHLDTVIVHTDRREGSRLSREGKELLEKYRLLKKECISADDNIFTAIFD